jgi:hypothetical protein
MRNHRAFFSEARSQHSSATLGASARAFRFVGAEGRAAGSILTGPAKTVAATTAHSVIAIKSFVPRFAFIADRSLIDVSGRVHTA